MIFCDIWETYHKLDRGKPGKDRYWSWWQGEWLYTLMKIYNNGCVWESLYMYWQDVVWFSGRYIE